MSDLVVNPEDRFSHNEAHIKMLRTWDSGSGYVDGVHGSLEGKSLVLSKYNMHRIEVVLNLEHSHRQCLYISYDRYKQTEST